MITAFLTRIKQLIRAFVLFVLTVVFFAMPYACYTAFDYSRRQFAEYRVRLAQEALAEKVSSVEFDLAPLRKDGGLAPVKPDAITREQAILLAVYYKERFEMKDAAVQDIAYYVSTFAHNDLEDNIK